MLDREITAHKQILRSQVLSVFTSEINRDYHRHNPGNRQALDYLLADQLYGRFTVEGPHFGDDYTYHKIYKYFMDVVVPHKIAVFKAGIKMLDSDWFKTLYVPPLLFLDNLLLHDLSKFSAEESIGYAEYNHASKSGAEGFEYAWNHHKNFNPHHPEHWLSIDKSGEYREMAMPSVFVLEMVADWIGAGKTYGTGIKDWLPVNLPRFVFHMGTSVTLQKILKNIGIATDFKSPHGARLMVV